MMETGVHKELSSTSPLSTISPRRIDTSSVSRSSGSSEEDKQIEQKIRQQENQILQQLQARDREVRAHEAAHIAAGRPYVLSGPSYTFQRGPDGRSYAIGGEVQLDVSEVSNNPEASLTKAETVRQAALAPIEPSPQDLRVAANATQMAAQARIEIAVQNREEAATRAEKHSNETSNEGDSANAEAIRAFSSKEAASSSLSLFA
ncbi:MAG: putative metalloprotease CJM1_0395 family protein [Gammaproteobacteria bacterium]|nr:putative metalloprotease CJM1_0395 family protein [Gammaproteobacteria bacterium]